MKRALRKVPLQAADVDVAGAPVAVLARLRRARAPRATSSGRPPIMTSADLTRLPPVSMVTGWWDLFVPLQLRDYAAIRAAGVTARIIVGPWLHGEPAELRAVDPARTSPGSTITCAAARRRRARRSGCTCSRPGTWLDFDEWPPPAHRRPRYYLRAAGGLARSAEPGDAPPDTFVYDPADPTPSAGGPLLQPPGKQADNAGGRGQARRADLHQRAAGRRPGPGGAGQRPRLRPHRPRARRPVRPGLRRRRQGRLPQRRRRHPAAEPADRARPRRPGRRRRDPGGGRGALPDRPTGCAPGTGSACRSAAARSRGTRATSAPASLSARRPGRCAAGSRSTTTRGIPPASCCRCCPAPDTSGYRQPRRARCGVPEVCLAL